MPCHTDPPTQAETYAWDAPGAACEAIKILEAKGLIGDLSPRTLRWWALHKQRDAEREAKATRERLEREARESALAKLTPEEAVALGFWEVATRNKA